LARFVHGHTCTTRNPPPVFLTAGREKGESEKAMATFFAFGIVLLFAYWVCLLKQEVGSLQRQVFSGVAPVQTGGAPVASQKSLPRANRLCVPKIAAPEPAVCEPLRRESSGTDGGIPTWTLG